MSDDWTDAKGLIALAAEHGHELSARSLELWRYRGLLPRGKQPKGRAAWIYPPMSNGQLLRLLHWREKTRSLDLILIALWIEGFQIDIDHVRVSLRASVDVWERDMTRELDGAGDVSSAIEALARKFAGKRGKAALPRIARMTADERIRACAYALAFAFNAEDEIERRKPDAFLFERMFGFRTGRDGGLATIMPLDEDTLRLAGLRPPDQLRIVIDSATDDEFEFVRRLLHVIVVWIPLLVPQFIERFGEKARPVGELARRLFDDLQPEFYAFATMGMIASLHAKEHSANELQTQLATVSPGAVNLELLTMLRKEERDPAFKKLSDEDRQEAARELQKRSRSSPSGAR